MTTRAAALQALAVQTDRDYYLEKYGEEVANYVISERVSAGIVERLGTEWVDFGTFDNCREEGLTYTANGWQFAVFEHRNSDSVMLEGCPVGDVEEWGPYGGADKWDMIAGVRWTKNGTHYGHAVVMLEAALRHVAAGGDVSRASVVSAARAALVAEGLVA